MISIDQEKAKVLAEMKEFLQPPLGGADDNVAASASVAAPETVRSSEHVRI